MIRQRRLISLANLEPLERSTPGSLARRLLAVAIKHCRQAAEDLRESMYYSGEDHPSTVVAAQVLIESNRISGDLRFVLYGDKGYRQYLLRSQSRLRNSGQPNTRSQFLVACQLSEHCFPRKDESDLHGERYVLGGFVSREMLRLAERLQENRISYTWRTSRGGDLLLSTTQPLSRKKQ